MLLLWAIGLVAAIGAIAIANAALVTGDTLPNGSAPLWVMAGVFAAIAVACFWPWGRKKAAVEGRSVLKEALDDVRPQAPSKTAIRSTGLSMLAAGALAAMGRGSLRMQRVPPEAVVGIGLFFVVLGILILLASLKQSTTVLLYRVGHYLLLSILIAFIVVPLFAIACALIGTWF